MQSNDDPMTENYSGRNKRHLRSGSFSMPLCIDILRTFSLLCYSYHVVSIFIETSWKRRQKIKLNHQKLGEFFFRKRNLLTFAPKNELETHLLLFLCRHFFFHFFWRPFLLSNPAQLYFWKGKEKTHERKKLSWIANGKRRRRHHHTIATFINVSILIESGFDAVFVCRKLKMTKKFNW